jgi:TPP-dependent pyruvate/acetoin dehydrogenase alpha subunit
VLEKLLSLENAFHKAVRYPVRGEEPALVEALKVRALPEGSSKRLVEFLETYKNKYQKIFLEPP